MESPRTILIAGRLNEGEKDILCAFTGKSDSAELLTYEVDDYTENLKGTKDNITVQGLPYSYGRFPSFRARNKAIAESNAFIIIVPAKEKMYGYPLKNFLKDYYKMFKENSKGEKMGPLLLLIGHKIDKSSQKEVSKWAKAKQATIAHVNLAEISKQEEVAKMNKIITDLAKSSPPLPTPPSSTPDPSPTPTPPSTSPTPTTPTTSPTLSTPTTPSTSPTLSTPTTLVPTKSTSPPPGRLVRLLSSLFTRTSDNVTTAA